MTSHGQRLAAPSSPWWGFALYGKAAGKLRSKGSRSCQALEKSGSAKGKDEASSGIAPFYSGSARGWETNLFPSARFFSYLNPWIGINSQINRISLKEVDNSELDFSSTWGLAV